MLAGVLLKMGTYGMIRFCLPLFPSAAHKPRRGSRRLAIIGIIYGALVCARAAQPQETRRLLQSSATLASSCLGIFAFRNISMQGAVYQMLAHGISTGALFLLVGMIYDRRHTFEISQFGGLATPMPKLAAFFLFVALFEPGLPMLNGFVGEYLDSARHLPVHVSWASWAALGVILSACYLLWAYQRVCFGEVTVEKNKTLPDASGREIVILVTMADHHAVDGNRLHVSSRTALRLRARRIIDQIEPQRPMKPARRQSQRRRYRTTACQTKFYSKGRRRANDSSPRRPDPRSARDDLVHLRRAADVAAAVDAQSPRPHCFALLGTIARDSAPHFVAGPSAPGQGSRLVQSDVFSIFFRLLIGLVSILVDARRRALSRTRKSSLPPNFRFGALRHRRHGRAVFRSELLTAFIGLEMSSISSYILAGYRRDTIKSSESAMKYFLLGSFATAFFLYGIALVYGVTGTTNLGRMDNADSTGNLIKLGLALILIGLGFKVAAAPFQIWTPDVYEGAPTPVTALFSAGPKAASVRAAYCEFSPPSPPPLISGSGHSGFSPRSRCSSATSARSCRPTSSACWPTAPSLTPATFSLPSLPSPTCQGDSNGGATPPTPQYSSIS